MADMSYWGIGGVPKKRHAGSTLDVSSKEAIDNLLDNIASKGPKGNPYKDMTLPDSGDIMSRVERPAWKDAIDKVLNSERDFDTRSTIDYAETPASPEALANSMKSMEAPKPNYQYDQPIGPEDEPRDVEGRLKRHLVKQIAAKRRGGDKYGGMSEEDRAKLRAEAEDATTLRGDNNVDIMDDVQAYEEPAETPIDYANDEEYTTVEGSAPSPRKDVEGVIGKPNEKSIFKSVMEALTGGEYDVNKSSKAARAAKRARYARKQKEADRLLQASNFKRALQQISNPWAGR